MGTLFFDSANACSILKNKLSENEITELQKLEWQDWLSSLYWMRQIAAEHALYAIDHGGKDEVAKIKWHEVYHMALTHQTMLADYLLTNKDAPLAPSPFISHLKLLFYRIYQANGHQGHHEHKAPEDYFLFEEFLVCSMNQRLDHIENKNLKALLYKVATDFELMSCEPERTPWLTTYKNCTDCVLRERKLALMLPLHLLRCEKLLALQTELKITLLEKAEIIFDARMVTHKPEPILQTFSKIPIYECFACHPKRHDGLLLSPKFNKSENKTVSAVSFSPKQQGMSNLAHGGFICLALDEMMGYAVILDHGKLALTSQLHVSFLSPVWIGQNYTVSSSIVEVSGSNIDVVAELINTAGKTVAKAQGKFVVAGKQRFRTIFGDHVDHAEIDHLLYTQRGHNLRFLTHIFRRDKEDEKKKRRRPLGR